MQFSQLVRQPPLIGGYIFSSYDMHLSSVARCSLPRGATAAWLSTEGPGSWDRERFPGLRDACWWSHKFYTVFASGGTCANRRQSPPIFLTLQPSPR